MIEEQDETQPLVDNWDIEFPDIKNNMYMNVAPDPDIVIRRGVLSNFLLCETNNSILYSPV